MSHLVHALGHIKINTRDIDGVVRDATEILGLHVTHSDAEQTWLSSNGRAAELVLRQIQRELDPYDRPGSAYGRSRARSRKPGRGRGLSRPLEQAQPRMHQAGVTFATPEGLRFEIHTPIRNGIYGRRHPTYGVGPNRMDHVNLMTPHPDATLRHLERICGLQAVRERMVNDSLSWMYGGNRQHHILGLVRGEVGLHHYAFEFREFNDYLKLGDLLDRFDKQMMWGPGRHRPGDNTYAYYTDVSGAMIECSGQMALDRGR